MLFCSDENLSMNCQTLLFPKPKYCNYGDRTIDTKGNSAIVPDNRSVRVEATKSDQAEAIKESPEAKKDALEEQFEAGKDSWN